MATQLFFLTTTQAPSDVHTGTDHPRLSGANIGWTSNSYPSLQSTRGAASGQSISNTVAGPTSGIEIPTSPNEWITPPIASDVTISGTITFNIRFLESDMMANVGPQVVIEVLRANALGTRDSNTLETIVNSEHGTETGTSETVHNWTASPTSTALKRGDRLRFRVAGNDAGGDMATGFTFSFFYNGPTADASGDSYVTFTENFSFESAPAGTVLYLTDTASDVDAGTVEKEAWTSRGGSAATIVRNTAAGWTTPLQWTDSGGGTAVEWYTKPLQALTLEGMAKANLRGLQSAASTAASIRCEIARVNQDGSSPTVWASWCVQSTGVVGGDLGTSETVLTCWPSGASLAVSNGQRLRIRVYLEDFRGAPLVTGRTATFYYNGPTADASGDSWVQLPQSVAEFAAAQSLLLRNRNMSPLLRR